MSLEAYAGDVLTREGFRSMEDLSNFSPSVEIDVQTQQQDVSIRGMGTTGPNLALEQAAPIFVDLTKRQQERRRQIAIRSSLASTSSTSAGSVSSEARKE